MLTKRFRLMLDMEAGHFDSINSNSNIDQKWNIFFRNISDRTQNTAGTPEILCVKNVRAIVVCGFLIK